ncbi:MAG: hypothetical protein J2P28_10160 [Actinobacteria bacterium]|nr:hypothetical protein [Actinomycetota bacterium]
MTPAHRRPPAAGYAPQPTAAPSPDPLPGGQAGSSAPATLRTQLGIFVFDIGAPIACYYLLRSLGVSPLAALAVGAILPAVGAVCQLVTARRVDPVAVLVITAMAVSIAVAALTHSPRLLLAKDGLVTALWGTVFVASTARRPVAFAIARSLMEGRRIFAARSWDYLWAHEPAFRRIWRVTSLIWGGALLTDAAIRALMAYRLPVDEVPGFSGVLWPCTLVVINIVTNLYYRRAGLYRLLGARWLRQS